MHLAQSHMSDLTARVDRAFDIITLKFEEGSDEPVSVALDLTEFEELSVKVLKEGGRMVEPKHRQPVVSIWLAIGYAIVCFLLGLWAGG